jgi:uncharacterized membrane protein YkgB
MGLLKDDLDYHFIRASMVIIYFFFGYQKWFDYEAQGLIPFCLGCAAGQIHGSIGSRIRPRLS